MQTFISGSFLTLSFHEFKSQDGNFTRKGNLLENNFLIGFVYSLYFERNIFICHYVPSCVKEVVE